MQGLLGRLPFAPIGPQAVRQMAEQKLREYLPQGAGRIIPAPSPPGRQPSMMEDALAGAGKLFGDIGAMREQSQRKEKAKEARAAAAAAFKTRDLQDIYKAAMLYEDAGMEKAASQLFAQADKLSERAEKLKSRESDVARNRMLARELFANDPVALRNATALSAYPKAFTDFVGKRLGPDDPRYQMLTDDEERALGLDVGGVYQRGPKGQITSVQSPRAPSAGTWVDLYNPQSGQPQRVKVGTKTHDVLVSQGWTGSRPQREGKTTVSDLFVPVYQKMMAGEELTPGEERAFQAYQRSDPMAQLLGNLFGNPSGLLDGPPKSGAPSPVPAGNDLLYRQALDAVRSGADLAKIRERLEGRGGTWEEFEEFRRNNGG